MTGTAIFPSPPINRVLEFLRGELAPTPQRWRATLRITLACVAASYPVMAFHLHVGLLVMILMFLITREDRTTTLLGTVLGLIGVTIACGILLLTYICFADLTWLRVLLVPTVIALGLFINRVLTLGPLGTVIGVPLALGIIAPDVISSTEVLTRFPFYLWWSAVLGLSVNLVVQYLLNPERAQSVLARGLILRLDAVHDALLGLVGEERNRLPRSLAALALEGASEPLQLLKSASAAEPFLKRNYAAVGAQIILVDRLVTAACVLEERRARLSNDAIETRLRSIATAARIWRQAILEGRWPRLESPDPRAEGPDGPPMLLEMERVLELVSKTRGAESLPDELKVFPKSSSVASDALSNPEYVHFAIKGALAGFICYLIFTLTAYQGIYTSVVTCIVCSLSTIGASVQKGVLRLAGSVVGGVLGVITLTCIFPYLDSIGGFWFPFAAVTGLAAYVTLSGPSLSYGGYQIGLAFYKCVLQSYGPYTELRVVRDRLIGILLGLAVFELINKWFWPVKALESIRAKLACALQTLAKLVALPDDAKDPAPRLTEAYALRLQAYQAFRDIHELLDSSKFEPGESVRRKLEELSALSQKLLLYLLAVIQHRPFVRPDAVPESVRVASLRFRTTLAEGLQIVAARANGQVDQAGQNLQGALAELEQSVVSQNDSMANVAAQVRARFELYQETVRILGQMAQKSAEVQAEPNESGVLP